MIYVTQFGLIDCKTREEMEKYVKEMEAISRRRAEGKPLCTVVDVVWDDFCSDEDMDMDDQERRYANWK